MPQSLRLFVAVQPSPDAVADLEDFVEVRRDAAPFRWTSPDQWHLTLAFTEAFPERALDDLTDRLERAARKRHPMTARFAGGGAFPNPGRAKILWAGVETDIVELDRLATGARAAVAKAGGAPDGQHFRAHLTLARLRHPIEATRWIRLLDSYTGPSWPLDRIVLVSSHLGEGPRGRPRYEVLGEWALGGRVLPLGSHDTPA